MNRNALKLVIASIFTSGVYAQFADRLTSKIAPDLAASIASIEDGQENNEIDLIVRFKTSTGLRNGVSRSARLSRRATVQNELTIIQSAVIRVPLGEVEILAASPEVEYISPDRDVISKLSKVRAATQADVQWSKLRLDGWGVRVAVIDSGITPNEAFSTGSTSRLVYSKSFLPSTGMMNNSTSGGGTDIGVAPPVTPDGSIGALSTSVSGSSISTSTGTSDGYGHGTHVASILGGDGEGTSDLTTAKYRGMAAGVDLVNLRVLDDNGSGKESYVVAALQWILTNKQDKLNNLNIRVINLSLGRPVFESYKLDPLCLAVEAAWKAGITVVVAAGNDGRYDNGTNKGYGTITSPANDPYVITVGAGNPRGTDTRTDDVPATYSSKGPSAIDHIVKPDIMAPGNRIVALATGRLKADNPTNVVDTVNSYMELSGTSMAAPVVAAAAALMIGQDKFLTPDQIKIRIMKTAWRSMVRTSTVTDPATNKVYTVRSDMFTVGAGYLDVYAALSDRYSTALSAQSPAVTMDAFTGVVRIIKGSNVVWGDSTLPNNVVWGDNVKGENVVWGDSVVWGETTPSALNVIWGESAIYGTSGGVSGEASRTLIKGE